MLTAPLVRPAWSVWTSRRHQVRCGFSCRGDSIPPGGLELHVVLGLISVSWTSQAMDTSKQTGVYTHELELVCTSLSLLTTYHKDIAQQLVFIRDQLREIDLTLQAIVAYND